MTGQNVTEIVGQIRNARTIILKVRWADGGRAMESHIDMRMVPGVHYLFTLDWQKGGAVGKLVNLDEGKFLVKDYGEIIPVTPLSYSIGGRSEEWNAVLGDRHGMALELMVRKDDVSE